MAIIPIHIRRAPFFKIFPYLIKNNFNLEKFNKDCFEGKIIEIWEATPAVKDIIMQKYPNAKKIGYFKTTESSALYLKEFGVDFLIASKIDEYDLNKYDLLIFETELQDDSIFKEAKIDYTIEDKQIKFTKKKGVDCFYFDKSKIVTDDKNSCSVRWCFAKQYFDKNKDFKLDYVFEHSYDNIADLKTYFYTKIN